jgi:hypothetical protein
MRVRQRIATGIRFYDEGWIVEVPEALSMVTAEYSEWRPVLISISGEFSGFLEFQFQVHHEASSWIEQSEALLEMSNLIAARTLLDWERLGLRLEMGPPSIAGGDLPQSLRSGLHLPLGIFALKSLNKSKLPILGQVHLKGQRIHRARLDLALTMKGGLALGNYQQVI